MAEETICEQVNRRLGELKLERNSFIPHWRELTDFLSPRTGKYLVIDRNKGIKANDKIINSCATTALRTLKSGMHAGMTSPARPWFRLTADDAGLMKSSSVKDWLYEVENRMRVVFIRSNFYNVMPMIYGCCGGHGTAAMMILEDDDTAIRCYPFPIGSFLIALDDRLKCDTLYRELPMTIRQCVQQFGLDNCSQTIRSLWDRGSYETPVAVTHAIEPNINRDSGKLNAKDKPYRSVHFETGRTDNTLLRESGFDEFPVMAPRWDVEGDDVYGYSPGMDALGMVKGLQFCEKRKAEALDKLVRPPMLADSSLRTQRSSIIAGDVTYIDNLAAQSHAGFRPAYQFSPNIEEIRADIEAMKKEIQHIFFEDMMSMFAISDVSNITATEVDERHQEKLLVLGPVIERFGEELYDPAIYRTFAIMKRRGMIPPPPPELRGRPFKIEYISIKLPSSGVLFLRKEVAEYAQKLGDDTSGVIVVDSKLRPVSFVPMSLDEMAALKTGDPATGSSAIMSAFHKGNGYGMYMVAPHIPDHHPAVGNMVSFADMFGGKLLDVVETKSARSFRQSKIMPAASGRFFQGGDTRRGYFRFDGPRNFEIGLLKDADLSTFIHESGHFFTEVLGDLAERPDAPRQIKDDYAALLRFAGVESRADILTEHHEKLARAFEAYLREGVAPSVEMRPVFQRMKAWLVSVYKDVAALGVRLNPEVRDVFGRMLATDAEIGRLRDRENMRPLFASAADAGMSQAEFDLYRKDAEQAGEDVHNDAQGEVMRAELLAIRRKAEKVRHSEERDYKHRFIPPVEFFKIAAKEAIGAKRMAEIQPHLYSHAEGKAARESSEALARKEYQRAGEAKYRELLNHYLYKEAAEAMMNQNV